MQQSTFGEHIHQPLTSFITW